MIEGISDYTNVKTPVRARIGLPGKPIAELTKRGQYIVSPGKENDITNILFIQTSIHVYEKLYSLDSLGVSEKQDKLDEKTMINYLHEKFREHFGSGPGGDTKSTQSGKKIINLYKIMKAAVYEN